MIFKKIRIRFGKGAEFNKSFIKAQHVEFFKEDNILSSNNYMLRKARLLTQKRLAQWFIFNKIIYRKLSVKLTLCARFR